MFFFKPQTRKHKEKKERNTNKIKKIKNKGTKQIM